MIKNIFSYFIILISIVGCQANMGTPQPIQWRQTLQGSSFGSMTESRKQTRYTLMKRAGFSAQNPESAKERMLADQQTLKEKLEPQNIRVHLAGRDLILTLFADQIFTNRLSLDLQPTAQPILADISNYLQSNDNTYVEITGHTDSVGHANANQRLSIEKARRIALYFVEDGSDPRRFFIHGQGENSPLTNNATPRDRMINRRIDIRISPILK